jgi:hypothetical protein
LFLYNKHNINIHAPCGIRTHNPSKRAAADPRLRPRDHWDRPRSPDRLAHSCVDVFSSSDCVASIVSRERYGRKRPWPNLKPRCKPGISQWKWKF